MKIALIGFGKMGKDVELAANEAGHSIVAKFHGAEKITLESLLESGAELAIDFTQPSAVVSNVTICGLAGIPIVIGTTGWESDLEAVQRIAREAGIGVILGSNFSIGVNLFLQIVRNASALVSAAGYDSYIIEEHHRTKKDFPSGTALRLGEAVLSGLKDKTRIASHLELGELLPRDTLLISSVRAGTITGTHTVGFDQAEDTIELTHRAKNRHGFAAGSVRAAEWIIGKTGFYRFEDHVLEIIESK